MCGTTMNACTQLLKNLGSFFYDAWRPITIHAPREGSDVRGYAPCLTAEISIHAPREGSDGCLALAQGMGPDISIHAPREGSDTYGTYILGARYNFYPRSPRGERRIGLTGIWRSENFYPRSPRGERPSIMGIRRVTPNFYPRSPRGERRAVLSAFHSAVGFLSTLPARGATFLAADLCLVILISIHAPREGSDRTSSLGPHSSQYFYPRSPRGERPFQMR